MRKQHNRSIFFLLVFVLLSVSCYAQPPAYALAGDDKQATAQKALDERMLQDYFSKTNITPTKNPLGFYYTIAREGEGKKIMAGQTVSLNYTGRMLDGSVFDSNTDTAFHHTEPLIFEVGKGAVIKGYDKGMQLLKKGSKATLYIPSGLGYGARTNSPVPPNSILIFDIEVLDVTK